MNSLKVLQAISSGFYRETSGHKALIQALLDVALDFPQTPKDFTKPEVVDSLSKPVVVLISGGQDSTVMLELTKDKDRHCLFVDVGQPYAAAERKAIEMLLKDEYKEIERVIPTEGWAHIIPGRNLILLLEAEKLCSHEGEIWLGAVQGESRKDSGDKSELFFHLFEEYIWRTKRKKITIKTLVEKTKNDWLKWYITTTGKTDILSTVTCFDPEGNACGRCQACARKWIALRYCSIETDGIFKVNPIIGCSDVLTSYRTKFRDCLASKDFSHYSKDRCLQDLAVIEELFKD